MKVTLAFKKGSKGTMSGLIRWFTKSDYSHVEIVIGDKWVSSNADLGGVSVRKLEPLRNSWDYIEVEVDGGRLDTVMDFIQSQEGKKYDYPGIVFSQLFKITRGHHQSKWFCSEIVTKIMQVFDDKKALLFEPANMSPRDMNLLYL